MNGHSGHNCRIFPGSRAIFRQRAFLPLDDFFSVAAGRGMDCFYNDKAVGWFEKVGSMRDFW